MKVYKYSARSSAGHVVSGALAASSLEEATGLARAHGEVVSLVPLAGETERRVPKARRTGLDAGPGLKDVYGFTDQLAVMVDANVSIRKALEGIAQNTKNRKFRKILEQVTTDVTAGRPFSEALAAHPKVFSPFYVNMVRAAEMSGELGHMLERIAQSLFQQIETRRMLIGAMVYPTILFFMSVGAIVFCLTFALPRFTALFAGHEALLPKPTKILMAISDGLRTYWYVLLGGLAAAILAIRHAIDSPWGRPLWDRIKLRIPIIRPMLRALYIFQNMRTMGELVEAGAPMLNILSISADISPNTGYKQLWMRVQADVRKGVKIARSLRGDPLLPSNVVEMVAAGEEAGMLGKVLHSIARYYEKELQARIKAVSAMIEPIMIIAMGVIVGFIAMSILLPVFKMSAVVGQ
jgi:type II secretory pathway component PulF